MVTILRVKRRKHSLPLDEISYETKKIKLDEGEEPATTSYFRFVTNNVKPLSEIIKTVKESNLKKIPKFVDVQYKDVCNTVKTNEMEWQESSNDNEFVYDFYCPENCDSIKDTIVDLIEYDSYSDKELDNYESDVDSNDEDYWGNEYIEDGDVILRCANYADEDDRDDNSSSLNYSNDSERDSDC